MGERKLAESDVEMVSVPLEDLRRLCKLNERLAQAVERLLNRKDDEARRYERMAGPTTAEAEARVERRLRKLGKL